MLYTVLIACAIALCVSGITTASKPSPISLHDGDTLPLSILMNESILGCFLETPDGSIIEFMPENKAKERFVLTSNLISPCAVHVTELSAKDNGVWRLYYTDDEDIVKEEISFDITIASNSVVAETTEAPTTPSVPFPITLDEGESLQLSIRTSSDIVGCYVTSPNISKVELKPTNKAESRLQLKDVAGSPCSVDIKDLSQADDGLWTLYYTDKNEKVIEEAAYDLTVNKKVNSPSDGPAPMSIEEGHTLHTLVETTGNISGCYIKTPNQNIIEFKPENKAESRFELREDSLLSKCSVDVKNVQDTDNGVWSIYYTDKANYSVLGETLYNVTVTQAVEDSKERDSEIMATKTYKIHLGDNVQAEIPRESFLKVESCHLITPSGVEYKLDQNVIIPNVYVISVVNSCKVTINVNTEDEIGNWTLYNKATRFVSDYIEKRLPVTIYVEESVIALPRNLIISEGKNLHIRLRDPTTLYQTCKLVAPEKANFTYELDSRNVDTCGFFISADDKSVAGTWSIIYGEKVVYRALFQVSIGDVWIDALESVTWYEGRSIEYEIGGKNAVFCKIYNPRGLTIFEGHGKCKIALDSVSEDDEGTWILVLGLNGRVLTDQHKLEVYVEKVPQLEVQTRVQNEQSSITLTCSVSSEYKVTTCQFQTPAGQILMVNEGVGEDKYISQKNYSAVTSLSSEMHHHDCGIQILNPENNDIGTWRCEVKTIHGTYYGFLSVEAYGVLPITDAEVSQGPVLKADSTSISAVEGDTIVLSCSIPTAIRYCYFRYENGTVFNISPGSEQYVGAGFQAGECGFRLPSALPCDGGRWTCNVGLRDDQLRGVEQQVSVELDVAEPIIFSSYVESSELVIKAMTRDRAVSLNYCRFVRMDGTGFTSDKVPNGYTSKSNLEYGVCELRIPNPDMLELHPWSVAVKLQGQSQEIVRVTPFLAEIPGGANGNDTIIYVWVKRNPAGLILCIVGIILILGSVTFSRKKNREWAYARGSTVRTSVQRIFVRSPPPYAPELPQKIPV